MANSPLPPKGSNELMSRLRSNIDTLRSAQNLHLNELAKKADVGSSHLYKFMQGRTASLPIDVAARLAVALGTDLDTLIGEEHRPAFEIVHLLEKLSNLDDNQVSEAAELVQKMMQLDPDVRGGVRAQIEFLADRRRQAPVEPDREDKKAGSSEPD